MKYKVLKPLFCPVAQKRFAVGEMVEVSDEHLESYKPYIEVPGAPKEPEPEKAQVTIEEAKTAPAMQVTERPKKKGKK